MNFLEVAFTCYPVIDLAASRAFYEGVLGLKPAMTMSTEEGGWVEYELGPHTLCIGKAPGWSPSPDGPSCGLEAEDFDAAILRAMAGVEKKRSILMGLEKEVVAKHEVGT